MTPEELDKLYEEFEKIFPAFINKKSREWRANPEINDLPCKKITDFNVLITNIWKISNKNYQERFWVRQEVPMGGDTFSETTLTFEEDAEAVLDARDAGRVKMTARQYEMLRRLFHLVENYKDDPNAPGDVGGARDEQVVNDPRWNEIGEYAKLVYTEITGEECS